MSNKYRCLNNLIWNVVKSIVALIIIALSLFLVRTTSDLRLGNETYNITVGVVLGVLFLGVSFGVIYTYNNMKHDVLIGEKNSIRNKRGSYQLRSTVNPENGTKIYSIVKLKVDGGYGAGLYSNYGADEQADDSDDSNVTNVPERREVDGDEISRRSSQAEVGTDASKRSKLDDIQGIDELKKDISRIVDSLVNPSKYERMGAKPTKGVLLSGPPGTGKTMLAKAIASDAKANFLYANGSDFIEKYVGVGAKRVRELFSRAKESTPSIIFIDEIDAIASRRESDTNSESLQTINAFLAELDGFAETSGVLVIAATNRPDTLDSAFTRAGRFDLKLAVSLPDREGREKILEVHSKNKPLGPDVNLKDIATKTTGFSGAELANLMNEAALIAAADNANEISMENVNDAFFKILMQGNKKKMKRDDTLKLIAWHEAGHALAIKKLTKDSVSSVTIIGSTSGAGGVTFRNPVEDGLQSKSDIENQIRTLYAGRAAEQVMLGDSEKITTGASNDIKQATALIKRYIENYGMGWSGLVDVSQFKGGQSTSLNEAAEMSKSLYADVLETLENNRETLRKIAESLLEKETLYEDELDSIIKQGNKEV